jgi:hypothetical protein
VVALAAVAADSVVRYMLYDFVLAAALKLRVYDLLSALTCSSPSSGLGYFAWALMSPTSNSRALRYARLSEADEDEDGVKTNVTAVEVELTSNVKYEVAEPQILSARTV